MSRKHWRRRLPFKNTGMCIPRFRSIDIYNVFFVMFKLAKATCIANFLILAFLWIQGISMGFWWLSIQSVSMGFWWLSILSISMGFWRLAMDSIDFYGFLVTCYRFMDFYRFLENFHGFCGFVRISMGFCRTGGEATGIRHQQWLGWRVRGAHRTGFFEERMRWPILRLNMHAWLTGQICHW